MIPPMSKRGMNAATSERLIDRTVNPIFPRAVERRLERRCALLDMPIDVLNDHDRVVDHEPDGDREGHQGQIVETEIENVHRGE
jgi:hypothetical protein